MFINRILGKYIFLRPIWQKSAFKNLSPNVLKKSCTKIVSQHQQFGHYCIRFSSSMSQKCITSFFKTTPKKENEDTKEKNERSSKRQRPESSECDSEASSPERPVKKADVEKRIKHKRQRIDSFDSETESTPKSDDEPVVKVEKLETSPKNKSIDTIKTPPSSNKPHEKTEKKTPVARKNDKDRTKKKLKSVTPESKKKVTSKAQLTVKGETNENKYPSVNVVVKKEKEDEQDDNNKVVSAAEYNPAKPKYHPIKDACWSKGEAVPYLALAKTFEAIESISARLKIVEILSNYLRSVIALTPEDLLPSIYMCLNQLAPAYHSLELGIAETYLMKAIGQCTGRSLAQMKSAAGKAGDLGVVAEQARAIQRTMYTPPPLTARKVFEALKEIARMTGQASVSKKIAKIQCLYVACRHSEARYLIRSLEGKLRIGLAEQSVLQALAQAAAATPPAVGGAQQVLDAAKELSQEQFKARVDEHALIIKTTYCECPNYELVVPVLLQHGVSALPQHCRLTPGIPLKPMLAHPTKGVHQIFNRFENEEFTCEWKYDGERAQIHVPSRGEGGEPDFDNATIFSRNQENNTSKYPDVLRRLPALLGPGVHSCVLDCEAVAYDTQNKQILPFQVLSTRKRKDASESEIVVRVCVFVFDLLYLNGRALVRDALADRRALLHEHFRQVEGEWQFATGKDCSTTEEVQQFLEESVRGSCEGLMVKSLRGEHARYDIARRSHNWLKLKKDYLEGVGDTVDVVVVGAYRGRGKRAGTFGGFLLACHDPETEEYQSLCKIGTGFSDEDLQTLTDTLQQHVIDGPRNYYRYDSSHTPDVWVRAACVWEVRCADLSLSPAHRAAIGLVDPDKGISLRFPRFIRVRDDKSPEQATSAQQIAELYLAQDQVKNQTTKPTSHDDFY